MDTPEEFDAEEYRRRNREINATLRQLMEQCERDHEQPDWKGRRLRAWLDQREKYRSEKARELRGIPNDADPWDC
jgi:hypothetical protein